MVYPPLALRLLAWLGAAVAFVAFAAGCVAPYDLTYPEPRPLGPALTPLAAAPIGDAGAEVTAPDSVALAEPLTLGEAVILALAQNPDLRAAVAEVRAREGEAYQASRLPNPEVEAGIEEFGGSGERAGTAAAEIGAGIAQTFELGGDRRARAAVAAHAAELGAWDLEAARLDLVTEVHRTFAAVLAAETRLALAEEQRDIARRFANAVARRAEAGAVSPLEARRSAVAAATAEAAFGRARRLLGAARARLAPLLGLPSAGLGVKGDLDRFTDVPPYDRLVRLLDFNPDVARYRTALAQAKAQVSVERARRIPDLTIRAGGTYFNEVGEVAVTAGISIPIPVLDTNRGAILAAEARVAGTKAEAEAALLRAERDLAEAYGTYAAAAETARTLRDDALPNARLAFEGVEQGYREGEFDLLAVLDAQRTLVETQNALADALADAAHSRAAVERLVARPLDARAFEPPSGALPNPDNE